MDKCSDESYLSLDKHRTVKVGALKKLTTLSQADWKSVDPPKKLNHHEFKFWASRSTGKIPYGIQGKDREAYLPAVCFLMNADLTITASHEIKESYVIFL